MTGGKHIILKQLEIHIKNFILKILIHNKKPVLIRESCRLFNSSNSILILRNDRIGDLLISSGIIRNLRQAAPHTRIDILLSSKNKSAQNSVLKYVDDIYEYRKELFDSIKLIKRLRNNKYDIVIDLFDKPSATSALIVKFIKARHSLGIHKDNKNAYTHIVPQLDRNSAHIIERTAQVLLAFEIEPRQADLTPEYSLAVSDEIQLLPNKIKKYRLGVVLSGSDRSKFWGIDNNVALINMINRNLSELESVLFCTRDYSKEINTIKSRCEVIVAPFVDSFDSFAMMLSSCNIIITPDTSAVHLASAFKIPAIVLYSQIDTGVAGKPWTPYKSQYKAILTNKSLSEGISPDIIFRELKDLIRIAD